MLSQKLLTRLKNASSVTALTGAGISAESGIPTFRGKDGLWENYNVQELATVAALDKNPALFWKFYDWRKNLIHGVKPNLGHYGLVDFERLFEDFMVITQNIDNLHQEAGNKKIIELHGNIFNTKCTKCNKRQEKDDTEKKEQYHCESCGGTLRPDVVLFGESLDENLLRQSQEAAAGCEVFFSIGTSSLVEPAASLPYLAKANGSYIVEINSEETPLSQHADESLRGPAGKLLPALVIIIERLQSPS
jgi:NAD-dependent deacetylase